MKLYNSVAESTAYNIGFLSGIRTGGATPPLVPLSTEEERDAWKDGVHDGKALRGSMDSDYEKRRALLGV